jgi:hypothetical protein
MPATRPRSAQVASAYARGNTWVCSGFGPWAQKQAPPKLSFESFVQQLPVPERQLLHMVHMHYIDLLVQGIKAGEVIAVIDGSFKDEIGTAGVILVGTQMDCKLIIQAITPGEGKDMSSYRSEFTGLLATLLIVGIVVGCDGLSALQQSTPDTLDINTDIPCWDIIGAIRKLKSISTVDWEFRHVKGHRDRQQSLDQLDA